MPPVKCRRSHFITLMRIAKSVQESVRILNTQNPASLCWLPAELLCHICDYLPIAEIFCLMISHPRFWHSRNSIPAFVKVQRLVHAPRLQQPYRYDLVEARFHILRLMEFDKIYGKGITSFCCWACMSTHGKEQFFRAKKRVNLKLSVEEQRVNWSAATRCCKIKRRRVWVGMGTEMSFAELRDLQLCAGSSTIEIGASGFFSERVELYSKTGYLSSWFYLGRCYDLGQRGLYKLCKEASIPICPHTSTYNIVYLGMHLGEKYRCRRSCPTNYTLTITSGGFFQLHISSYIGFLTPNNSLSSWNRVSSHGTASHTTSRCQAFSDWLDRMYNPETGAVFNGGQFEMFKRGRKPRSSGK